MSMRFLRHESDEEEENHFWISISDLMTSLLFVFILILAYMILEYQDKEQKAQENIQAFEKNIDARTELLETLQSELLKIKISVEIDNNDGTMRITKEKLFNSSKAQIKENKKWIIAAVTKELLYLMKKDNFHNAINTIFIEGHTDNVALNKQYSGFRWTNMELSSQRAINTFLLMDQYSNGELVNLKNIKNQSLVSYSGYADTRPIRGVLNDTKEGRERNRRIQFFFAVNPPDLKVITNEF